MKLYEIARDKKDLNDAVNDYGKKYNDNMNSLVYINKPHYTFFPTLAFDKNNCGQCGNKCEGKKEFCVYGQCLSYEEFY